MYFIVIIKKSERTSYSHQADGLFARCRGNLSFNLIDGNDLVSIFSMDQRKSSLECSFVVEMFMTMDSMLSSLHIHQTHLNDLLLIEEEKKED